MANVLLAIIGEDNDAKEILIKGFSHFLPETVILLTKSKYVKKSEKIKKELAKLNIETYSVDVSNYLHLEEVFMKITEISKSHSQDTVVINVDTDYMSSCLALSSAFVSGIQAIGILGEDVIAYPVMKFSYYNAINEKKMKIIKLLNDKGAVGSMDELSKLSKMSLPLIAYHLKGNRDSKGLVEMNLVETTKRDQTVCVSLTELGKLLANGYIEVNNG